MKYISKKLTVLLTSLLATAVVLCSCGKTENSEIESITGATAAEKTESTPEVSPPQVMLGAVPSSYEFDSDAFSSYTFSVSDGENNYMITVSGSENESSFKIITEDNAFNYSEFTLTAPENYVLNVPFSQDDASSVCTVLKNAADNSIVPDIIQFTFYLDNFDTEEELPYTVKRFYSVKDNAFTEIEVFDASGEKMDFIPEFTLLRTEGTVFMPIPTVEFAGDGSASVELEVYDFNADDMTLTKRKQSADFETDKLYYGYAAKAVADNIAKYFTTTSLNVSDYENYVEVDSLNSDIGSSYFFYVDDPRFSTKSELESFVKKYFDAKTTDEMFINAPQKYRDIDGKLCTIVGDAGISYIGDITITGYNYNEKAGTITYNTKAERFDENGKFIEFIDGGDFTLEINTKDQSFKITQYKLNY
ncbi:MAG: hypothetical protein ACI4I1_11395 [Oscillospiraceae bacterium]